MMMNRFAFDEEKMARLLLLVSPGQATPTPMPMPVAGRGDRATERAFVCKTCGRVFSSFQALGGHRASHKKPPRLNGDIKPKLHGCSICGLKFATGQALSSHVERHRAMAPAGGDQEACRRRSFQRQARVVARPEPSAVRRRCWQ